MRRSNKGFTLIEIIVALAILGIMVAAITVAVLGKVSEAKAQRAVQEVSTIEKGVASWIQRTGQTTFTGLSMTALTTAGVVPSALAATTANPWGGAYTVAGTTNDFTISITNVPTSATCQSFQGAFSRRATVTCPSTYPGTTSILFTGT